MTLRPNFVTFLKKIFDLNGGEFRIIDRYEVGKQLGMSLSQTDDTVKQLCDIGMIKLIEEGRKIILTQEALAVIDRSKSSIQKFRVSRWWDRRVLSSSPPVNLLYPMYPKHYYYTPV